MDISPYTFGVHSYTNRIGIMASKTSRVSARVPEELVRSLEGIMDEEGISSISECLRECIEEYINLKTTRFSTEKIVIDIGEDILSDIDNLVDIGRVSGREEAIKHAIKSWTESHVERYILGRERYFKTVAETKGRILESRGQSKINSYLKSP
ncbi:MAG: ribbon-helix-helix protein, CopG family [Methanomassiliicoccales archaeon]|nr:MAG: ribbon-helix-helix protein, CopG family [Methanomassiliicoccales archaeon]